MFNSQIPRVVCETKMGSMFVVGRAGRFGEQENKGARARGAADRCAKV